LWEGGLAAVQASDDPLIQFLLRIQEPTRAARSEYEGKVQAPTDRASEALARARFAVYGTSLYPDATGTLRLTYGRLRGYSANGRTFPYATTFRRVVGAGNRRRAVRLWHRPGRRGGGAFRPTRFLDVAASSAQRSVAHPARPR
jgi:hypothetical protein